MKNTTNIHRLNSGGTVVYKMEEDNGFMESQANMWNELNKGIRIAETVELF